MVIAGDGIGAPAAQFFPVAHSIAIIVDTFSADGAEGAFRLVAGKFFFAERNLHPLLAKKQVVRQLAVG